MNLIFQKELIVSLADSLPEDQKSDEYEEQLDKYYHYDNKVKIFKYKISQYYRLVNLLNLGIIIRIR